MGPRQLVEAARNLVGRNTYCIRELSRVVLVPAHVDEHGAFLQEPVCLGR